MQTDFIISGQINISFVFAVNASMKRMKKVELSSSRNKVS